MEVILNTVFKNKIFDIFESMSKDLSEIVIDIDLEIGICNTIEIDRKNNNVTLHFFDTELSDDESMDVELLFEDLDYNEKIKVYKKLKRL